MVVSQSNSGALYVSKHAHTDSCLQMSTSLFPVRWHSDGNYTYISRLGEVDVTSC
jgi:hypothetical protein